MIKHLVPIVCDSRLKFSLFKKNPDLFPAEWLEAMTTKLIGLMDGFTSSTSTRSTSEPAVGKDTLFDGTDFSDIVEDDEGEHSAEQTSREELAAYLAERRNNTLPPLDFWRSNEKRFPRLACVARNALAIPGAPILSVIFIINPLYFPSFRFFRQRREIILWWTRCHLTASHVLQP